MVLKLKTKSESQENLTSFSILDKHATFTNADGKVTIAPQDKCKVVVNGVTITEETELQHSVSIFFEHKTKLWREKNASPNRRFRMSTVSSSRIICLREGKFYVHIYLFKINPMKQSCSGGDENLCSASEWFFGTDAGKLCAFLMEVLSTFFCFYH